MRSGRKQREGGVKRRYELLLVHCIMRAVPCCAVPCHAVLRGPRLCHVVLWWDAVMYTAVLCCAVLCCAVLCCAVRCGAVLHLPPAIACQLSSAACQSFAMCYASFAVPVKVLLLILNLKTQLASFGLTPAFPLQDEESPDASPEATPEAGPSTSRPTPEPSPEPGTAPGLKGKSGKKAEAPLNTTQQVANTLDSL